MIEIWSQILTDFSNLGTPSALAAFGQVLIIDVMLAGDNAIVVGALAAGLPAEQRRKVILILAGGLLLLWVAWKMYRELRSSGGSETHMPEARPARSFASAAWSVAIADVSMSLDNVLAVAGAAREHPGILIVGLMLSVALMGIVANLIARYIDRYRWIAYIGLIVILWVALKMIYEGVVDHKLGVLLLISG
jgi:predicted tellurium resistance membrane protein TerC